MRPGRSRTIRNYLICGLFYLGWFVPNNASGELYEIKTGVGPVFGTEFTETRKAGIGLQGYFEFGLSELFNATFSAGYVQHSLGSGESYGLTHAGLGVSVNLDVLTIVPYLSVRLGFLHQNFSDRSISGLGMAGSIGGDYLVTDSFTLGLALEYHGLVTDLDGLPSYLAIAVRCGYRWLD